MPSGQKGHHGVNDNGFIVIHRQLKEWEWHDDPNTLAVWIYILLETNWQEVSWHGITIPRGSALLSYSRLSLLTGLSTQSVRTAIEHLKSTGEITCQSTRFGLLINVINYAKYQDLPVDSNTIPNTESTGNQQESNRKVTTEEQYKQINKETISNIYSPKIAEIIGYLNERTGQNLKPTTKMYAKHIVARLKENYTLEDFKTVIDKKCVEWMGTDMQKYLRPETLFGTKFDQYLNQPVSKSKPSGKSNLLLDMINQFDDTESGVFLPEWKGKS